MNEDILDAYMRDIEEWEQLEAERENERALNKFLGYSGPYTILDTRDWGIR